MSNFHKKYIKPGLKRKSPDYVVESSQPSQYKKRKISYEVPDNSPAWNMVIPEKKGVDTQIVSLGIVATTSTNAEITALNLIQPGTGSWNRIGKKTKLKSVRVVGYVQNSYNMTTGDLVGNVLLMALVWDKQPSGNAIPNFDQIFGYTNQSGTENSTIYSPPKYDNMDRFRVLKRELIEFIPKAPPLASGDFVNEYRAIDCYLKLNNLESVYSGQSNPMTISDISTGALYLVLRCQENSTSTSVGTCALTCRVRYTDA